MSMKISDLTVTTAPQLAKVPADVDGTDRAVAVGVANGLAYLGADAKLVSEQLPASVVGQVEYQGTWAANGGSAPTATPEKGWYYIVSVAGITNVAGIVEWAVGDWIIYNGTDWQKVDNTDAVISVAGLMGAVSAPALVTALGIDLKADADDAEFTGVRPKLSGADMALRELTQNQQNANYTFALPDSGGIVFKDNATAYAWTIPPNSSVAFPIGTMITGRVKNADGAITLTQGSGVMLRKAGFPTSENVVVSVWGLVTLLKEGTNEWVVSGTGI